MIFAFTDMVWHDFFALVGLISLAWMNLRTKAVVTRKLDENTKVTEEVHGLVNSAFLHQLRLHAHTARILSDVTNEPAHRQIADEAERVLREHLAAARIRENKSA